MKINLKVRMKNPTFWYGIAAAIILPILAAFGMTWDEITDWRALGIVIYEAVKSPVILLSVIVSVYNALIDPTTKGLSDSDRALSYDKPGGDGNDG